MNAQAQPPIHFQLTTTAAKDLFGLLGHKNELHSDHRDALIDVLSTYSDMATQNTEYRRVRAFPLSMGLGKTQSVASWCYAVSSMGRNEISVLICGEQLDDLDSLRTDIIERGVDADTIGFMHTVKKRGLTEASTGSPDEYQFLLVSHQMVRCSTDIEDLNQYRGNERSLCIWDESLVRNEGGYITASDVSRTLAAAREDAFGHFSRASQDRDQSDTKSAIAYITKGLERVKLEYDAQVQVNAEPSMIDDLPEIDSQTRQRYRAAIQRDIRRPEDRRILGKFLELCQSDLRVNRLAGAGGNGEGVISFIPKVPRSLKRLVILDASCMIRELTKMDESIEIVEKWSRVKTFEQVHVTQYADFAGGWNTLSQLRSNSKVITHIVDLIKYIPANESILICSRKSKGGKLGPLDKVRAALEAAGVNLNATSSTPIADSKGHRKWSGKRINFIHWGQHKATSQYAHCKHVFALGVLRRDQLELSSAMAAQAEDVMDPRVSDHKSVRRVLISEQFYCLQQLIGRGPARESVAGRARESHIHVYDQTDFSEYAQEGLPCVNWETVKGVHKVKPKRDTKASKLAIEIGQYLERQPKEIEKFTVRQLKVDLGIDSSQSVFQSARDTALSGLDWKVSGRSIVRS